METFKAPSLVVAHICLLSLIKLFLQLVPPHIRVTLVRAYMFPRQLVTPAEPTEKGSPRKVPLLLRLDRGLLVGVPLYSEQQEPFYIPI